MRNAVSLLLLFACLGSLTAQDRFEQALALSKRTANLVFRDRVEPQWLPDGKSFWYRVATGRRTQEFVLIDAETGERKTAPDLAELKLPETDTVKTSELTLRLRSTSRTGQSSGLKFVNKLDQRVELFWINRDGEHIPYDSIPAGGEHEQHTFGGHVWLLVEAGGGRLAVVEAQNTVQTIVIDGKAATRETPARRSSPRGNNSPDSKWSVSIDQGRVMLRDRKENTSSQLKTPFDEKLPFHGSIAWAPDSSAFVATCAAEVAKRTVTIVESAPKNELQPQLKEITYVKPGDPLPKPLPVLFRLGEMGAECIEVDNELFPNPFTESYSLDIEWAPDSSEFYFDYNQRGHQLYRILAVNASDGKVRTVVEETSPTFIDYAQKTWRHWLPESGELLWMSERDGWCHLWLYEIATGQVKHQVTHGSWPVRDVLHVDAERREIWFMASGLRPEESPYHRHLCRVNFDGSSFQQLTAGDGDHRIQFSPTREYFVDRWSRVDQPPVHELRRSRTGELVCVLEQADASELMSAGWSLPERFVAKGRDGQTDIHGFLIKPSHFDPSRKYPVVEEIYAGPHSAAVPKEFGMLNRQHAMAELGFIVVQIDGMGTNHRGKAFHDACWKNLKDAGFPDRIAWIKAAAAERPWMDLSRVGIYGGSAGGQNALRALLDHHDFYHVAVADCGCHDNRMDKIWWNEQWMGWPVDESYARSSNRDDAHKLQGKLLLLVGELDTNVDPASTTQVVGALQKAGKAFDFMPIMGTGHGSAETPYGSRLRMEFLVRHLKP